MIKLYLTPNTRAGRIAWILEELNMEYELEILPFTKEGLKSPEHRARHALGRVPVIEDGDISIFESGAIIQYILDRYDNKGLKPEIDSNEYPYYLQWFHYCEGMVMPPMNQIVVQNCHPTNYLTEFKTKRPRTFMNGWVMCALVTS